MEHQQMGIFEKFTWKIENFSRLNTKELYSAPFMLDGYPWRILVFPKGNDVDNQLSIYLEAMQTANMSEGWSRDVKFKLLVFNQFDTNITVTRETNHVINANQKNWGFHTFMSLSQLYDPNKGFIVKNVCIVGAEVSILKVTHENQVNQEDNLTVCTKDANVELFSPSVKEITDFTSIGHLEEINSHNTSHIESEPKKSHKFTDFAFAALGRVFYFLKTRKVKDMNEEACKNLQALWDEVEKHRFDLTCIEPHVQYALGLKSYVEKALEVEKLKQSVVAILLETERLKAKLAAAEVNLNIERYLLKSKGFKQVDLDSQLGCGIQTHSNNDK